DNAIGPVAPVGTGSVSLAPVVTTTYTMTVSGARTPATCSATVTVHADIADQVWYLARHPESIVAVTRWRGAAEHIYTTDDTAPPAFASEGTAFAVSAIRADGMIPLYRLKKGTRLYTLSDAERAAAL